METDQISSCPNAFSRLSEFVTKRLRNEVVVVAFSFLKKEKESQDSWMGAMGSMFLPIKHFKFFVCSGQLNYSIHSRTVLVYVLQRHVAPVKCTRENVGFGD